MIDAFQHHVPVGALDSFEKDDGKGPSHRHSHLLPFPWADTLLCNPRANPSIPLHECLSKSLHPLYMHHVSTDTREYVTQ